MKLCVFFALLISITQVTPYYMSPGLVTADTQEEFLKELQTSEAKLGEKIASGTVAKLGEYPELCYLSIKYIEKSALCGCWILTRQRVVTSARCVVQ